MDKPLSLDSYQDDDIKQLVQYGLDIVFGKGNEKNKAKLD